VAYRFFLQPNEINWQEKKAVISSPDHTHKISQVLRLRPNDQIVLLDGKGIIYNAEIASFYSRGIQCRLLGRRTVNSEPDLKITIAQALLKGPKFDYALQKNTEIGVSEFIPITTERTVIKLEEDELLHEVDKRIERYKKIVRDASEQSERGIVPEVKGVMSIEELCKSNLAAYNLKLVCLERSKTESGIKEVLNSNQTRLQKVLILIGPEGGFTEGETKLVLSNDFTPISLGKRIYRSETVGTVICSILYFYSNELK
jgi:16S rRNA (uracil1498-N3)-methyltransferase